VQFQLDYSIHSLRYRIRFNDLNVIEDSTLGIILDSVDLSEKITVGRRRPYRIRENYSWRGNHSKATDYSNGAKFSIRHSKSGQEFELEVRVFNDGVGFRFIVPGDSIARVPDEKTEFTLPAGSTVWFHDFEGHYEGIHVRKNISEVKAGEWAAPPLTFKLPGGRGYASITEAALIDYSGMGLQADGKHGFQARLGHSQPVSYPFRLRYEADQERLKVPAAIKGTITTPWRVVTLGADLNRLVNSDIIHNLSPPPDSRLFPSGLATSWIKPGRAVWRYLDGGQNTIEDVKEFSKLAGQLGFEYQIVEGFWQRWTDAQVRDVVAYSSQQGVGIWFWKHSRDLRTPDARKKFFKLCNDVGVVGAKIDFFDHEAKEIIDLYHLMLRDAAEHRILVNFHGANKPAGESRTWPNELTREGIRGLEYRSMQTRAVHDTTLPFTRMLAGHADYTPVHFGERRRETSWAHQIASAAIFTSPILIYGAHPRSLLDNPAVEIIKSIPSVWDETIALPPSEIGEIAIFARRNGRVWFLAIMNGSNARTIEIPLSFLDSGTHDALMARDQAEEAGAVKMDTMVVTDRQPLSVSLRSGGGFVGRFVKNTSR
jgi:alpha-glucosidase